ncbi:MAG: hypothetical protein OXC94_03905 [Chloroflexi bacterium]|nr:hypothetical protein [Chloroflexota bacterium]
MKFVIIAGLIPLLAIGSALSAYAASRTIETEATIDVRVWQSRSSDSLYLSTRPEGGEWTTHPERLLLTDEGGSDHFRLSTPATLSLPVVVEVEQPEVVLPASTAEPLQSEPPPSGRASCCTVRGMTDQPAARRDILTKMRGVIAFAGEEFGLTHRGPITLHISHTLSGLFVRYEQAFGEELDELPSTCSFQRGAHIFLGPDCRADERVIAREWIARATDALHVRPQWAATATVEYYLEYYLAGASPTLRDDPFRRAIFFEDARDFRLGRASDEMSGAAMLYAIRSYGSLEDWLAFYDHVRDGREEHAAFEAAFGVPLARLYADFEEWAAQQKTILTTTAYGSCLEAASHIRPRTSSEGGGFPDFRVPLEWDEDADGYVCEGYAAFQAETLACVVIGEDGSE